MNEKVNEIVSIVNDIVEEVDVNETMIAQDLCELGMDSIAFVKVIIEIEDKYDIEIPDKYLKIQDMNTIEKIVSVLDELM